MTTKNNQNLQEGVENSKNNKKFNLSDWWYDFKVKFYHWWHSEPVVFNTIIAFIVWLFIGMLVWVLTLVFLNPLILWILGFIFPKWIVVETHQWCKKYEEFGLYLYWKAFRGVFEYLPWYARKQYLNYTIGLSHVGTKDQWRMFSEMSEEEQLSNVRHLNDENINIVWDKMPALRPALTRSIYLSAKQFKQIMNPFDQKTFDAYLQSHLTLRGELLRVIRDTLETQDCEYLHQVLALQIEANGAPTEVLEGLGGCTPNVFKCVKDAMQVYAERQAVLTSQKSGDHTEWKEYCEYYAQNKKQISPKAQVLMNWKQYDLYHAAGLSLDPWAIEYLIRQGGQLSSGMAERIFKYETIAMTADIEAAFYASPDLYQLYISHEVKHSKSSTL